VAVCRLARRSPTSGGILGLAFEEASTMVLLPVKFSGTRQFRSVGADYGEEFLWREL